MIQNGLDISPTSEVLVEECLLGWKEYEMEVMRDHKDQCVVICSIENFDPMGVHTGDSITIAPAMTLTEKEYQLMRDASLPAFEKSGWKPVALTFNSPSTQKWAYGGDRNESPRFTQFCTRIQGNRFPLLKLLPNSPSATA